MSILVDSRLHTITESCRGAQFEECLFSLSLFHFSKHKTMQTCLAVADSAAKVGHCQEQSQWNHLHCLVINLCKRICDVTFL